MMVKTYSFTPMSGRFVALSDYEAERERADALAVHVERMSDLIRQAHKRGANQLPHWLNAHLVAWQQDKPTTSLARLKAEWQAEALQGAAEAFDAMGGPAAYLASSCLKDSAAKIRHQAEEAPCSSTSPSASPSASC